ncbi:MAG: MFS transporter, partial [Dongiaceae bacterium]
VSLMAADAALLGDGNTTYLSMTGVAFVLPYLLLSGYAGAVADRFSKRRVLLAGKLAEIAVMMMGFAALLYASIDMLLAVLFLLAIQATFFSPAKYGIVPELLPETQLSRANGLLEMSRYVAIILGTAGGGLLMALWAGSPAMIGGALLIVAAGGALACLAIADTQQPGDLRPITLNPAVEAIRALRLLSTDRVLACAVGGITCFDFVASLVMLDMLLVGKSILGLDNMRIGLLGGVVAFGAAGGSLLAGRLSIGRIEPSLALLGAVGIALALLAFGAAMPSLAIATVAFAVLGVCGGLVIVPLNALVQFRAPAANRGQIIAANNLLNMAGVLAASGWLWALNDLCGVPPLVILFLVGAFVAAVAASAAVLLPHVLIRGIRIVSGAA